MFFLEIRPLRPHQLGHRVIQPGETLTRCAFKTAEDRRWFLKSIQRSWSAFEAVEIAQAQVEAPPASPAPPIAPVAKTRKRAEKVPEPSPTE